MKSQSVSSVTSALSERTQKRKRAEKKKIQYREDLEAMVEKVLIANGHVPSVFTQQIRKLTISKVKSFKNVSPLYYFFGSPASNATSITVGNSVFNRPDPRVLYHILRPGKHSNAADSSDASSHLAVFFIEDVLLEFHNSEGDEDSIYFKRLESAGKIVGLMKKYYDRGFRVVLLDHIPSLHFGSIRHIERCLNSLFREVHSMIAELSICASIVLSVVSNLQATLHGRMESFSLPGTGLWQFFVHNLNSSLSANTKVSFVVGTSQRKHAFQKHLHSQFAAAIALPYWECGSIE